MWSDCLIDTAFRLGSGSNHQNIAYSQATEAGDRSEASIPIVSTRLQAPQS